MPLTITSSQEIDDTTDAVSYAVFDSLEIPSGRSIDDVAADRQGFSGKVGESLSGIGPSSRIEIAIGLGDAARLGLDVLRRFGAGAARAAAHCRRLAIEIDGLVLSGVSTSEIARAVTEGVYLASYSFQRFKSEPELADLEEIVIVSSDAAAVLGADQGSIVGEAVTLCRDLINTPAGDLAPRDFASIARMIAEQVGLGIEVLELEQIREERLGGLLGVAAGSNEPPRFVKLSYVPAEASQELVALVGKGITFDSGGLSIKSGPAMMTMKYDMSGAAAVLSTMSALGRLGIKVRVNGYMPLTENLSGGSATKPGDVLTIRNGKTIEVLNTDAEGRLVLADALSLAVEDEPSAIIDLATLTGACVVALGKGIAGLMGNDDGLIADLEDAGQRAGEPSWPLPLPAGYRRQIDSEIADMKNIGADGQAGTLAAALLLQEFVGSIPWAHLDIAGPAYSDEDKGYARKGATGFGVRTLLAYLDRYQPLGREADGEAKGIQVLR